MEFGWLRLIDCTVLFCFEESQKMRRHQLEEMAVLADEANISLGH